jgi:uncharacterized membrane protein YgcG
MGGTGLGGRRRLAGHGPTPPAEAWSDIDVQLKRRADLVPNLVETVRASPRTIPALYTGDGTFTLAGYGRDLVTFSQRPKDAILSAGGLRSARPGGGETWSGTSGSSGGGGGGTF